MSKVCLRCKVVFSSTQCLQYHQEKKVCLKTKVIFECLKCKTVFSSKQMLQYHQEKKVCLKTKIGLECLKCKTIFSSSQRLQYHLDKKICLKSNFGLECLNCKTVFSSKQRLQYHLDKKVCLKPHFGLECSWCERKFSSGQRARSHVEVCNRHFCGDKSWHNSRCTTDYNLTDIVCFDCGDLAIRCSCGYIKKAVLSKLEIDKEFGLPYFDILEGVPWENRDFWSQECIHCGEIREEGHIWKCLAAKRNFTKSTTQ